jgi:type II secretory pathway pseudopilin PulG
MRLKTRLNQSLLREFHTTPRNPHATTAFTLLELLMILAIVVISVGMISPPFAGARQKAQRIKCVGNLKNIGLSFRIFATDHGNLFPWQSTNTLGELRNDLTKDPLFYFVGLSNELSTPRLLHCPADTRSPRDDWTKLALTDLSYVLCLNSAETYPQSLLSADRNLTTNGVRLKTGVYRLNPDANVGWDNTQHKNQGDTCMGDGSVQQLSAGRLRAQFADTGQSNIVLSIP